MNDGFAIGHVRIHPRTVLAPLAGITSLPFRQMMKDKGCGLVTTEMISARALMYESEKTVKMLERTDSERPLAVQLFGEDPAVMADAAARVQDMGADLVDINFGCSVRKVVKTGAGVALMRDPQRAEQLLMAVRKALHIPLTIKMRSGWEPAGHQAFHIAEIAEHCGVDAITYHPRTAQQRFGGRADRSLIRELKNRISLPVIGNGDISSAEDAVAMIRETGCDAVMIGRAAMAYPEIFRETACLLDGKPKTPFSIEEHFFMIEAFVESLVAYHGEDIGTMLLRSRLCFLVKGLRGAVSFRKQLSNITSKKEILEQVRDYRDSLLAETLPDDVNPWCTTP